MEKINLEELVWPPSYLNGQNPAKYDESYLSTVPNMLPQKYFC